MSAKKLIQPRFQISLGRLFAPRSVATRCILPDVYSKLCLVRRFEGETLPPNARVAVISGDALGNFVVVTPLLQLLRRELRPASIDYYGGRRIQELQDNSKLF